MAERWWNENPSTANGYSRQRMQIPDQQRMHFTTQPNNFGQNFAGPLTTNGPSTGWHNEYLVAQSSTSYTQKKHINQPTRNTSSSINNFQASTEDFAPDIEKIAKHIQNIWATWKQSKVLTDTLRNYFKTSSNPYATLLKLINVLSEERSKGKASTMINTITEEFYKWIKLNECEYEHILTDELKVHAFQIVLQKRICQNTIITIVKIFKCNTCLDVMEELIRDTLKQKGYKEACYATMSLNLQERFIVEDFVLPLYFMNLVSVTEEFLATSKFQQEALVKYFDNLLMDNDDCLYQLANRLNVTSAVNNNFCNKSQIKSNLSRIMKKYNIPNELAPNITKLKTKGALKFMFHRYQSGVTGIDGWREMVLESIGHDRDMMLEVVKMLDNFGDFQEGVYFANLFSIDQSLLPPNIQQELLFSDNASARIEKPILSMEYNITEYHELSLSDRQIHIIDCASKFNEFLDKINVEVFDGHLNVLGLDCEWKPELTRDKSDLASIQLATTDDIYIFHLPQMQPAEQFKLHWQEFAMNIFSNINILKLGFEWKSDASMIKSTLPIDNIPLYGPGFIDMKLLWKELETKWNFQCPYQSSNEDIVYNSLSDLVKLCFGKPLNKIEQFSNWEKIPLRFSQVKYAALDAYCLLEIYNLFKTRCKACNIPFDEVCQSVSNNVYMETMKPKPKHKKHKYKVPTTNIKSISPYNQVSSVKDFKLLVPNTLEKLAERLRKCGIDTSIIDRSKINDCWFIVNLVKMNNLHFIAFGHAFSKVAEQLRIGQCYCVENHNLDDQVQEVLNYFKIIVKKEDLNSRCRHCNSDSYETVRSSVMKNIYDTVKSLQNQPAVRYTTYDDDYDDEYYPNEDDYSDDEGNNAPINVVCSTNSFTLNTPKPEEESYSKLLSGYTNENQEINVKLLSPDIFNDQNRMYNICNTCGSVSWDNSHWESALGSSVGMKYK